MCGGSEPMFRSSPATGWRRVLDVFNDPASDNAIFIEATRGCWNERCPFACQARKDPYSVNIQPHKIGVIKQVFPVSCGIMFYGYGEASRYPYAKLTTMEDIPRTLKIAIMPSVVGVRDLSPALLQVVKSIILNVYDNNDVIAGNRLSRAIRKARRGQVVQCQIMTKIPVTSETDYFGMASRVVGSEILFHAVSIGDKRHVPKEQFASAFKSHFGVLPEIKDLPDMTRPGVKPVIEKIVGDKDKSVIVIRRCFRKDSQKHVLVADQKVDYPDYSRVDDDKSDRFLEFLRTKPPCDGCALPTWRAWVANGQ